KKCTLCIDKIYNETLEEAARVPACVSTCPASARHFGDLGDPQSAVSKLVRERDGYDLMPELGYAPTNKYLPPRPRRSAAQSSCALARGNHDRFTLLDTALGPSRARLARLLAVAELVALARGRVFGRDLRASAALRARLARHRQHERDLGTVRRPLGGGRHRHYRLYCLPL